MYTYIEKLGLWFLPNCPNFCRFFLVYVLQAFVVILRKMTGGPLQIDPNVVGSLYFVFSKLTMCTIRVSLDGKRWQLHSNSFWHNLHLLNNLEPTFLQW